MITDFLREILQIGGARDEAESFRRFLEDMERIRDEIYVNPQWFTFGYWWTGDYEHHLRWMEKRFDERSNLNFLNHDIEIMSGYWETLEHWASLEDTSRRSELLRQHRTRVDLATRLMVPVPDLQTNVSAE